jgi:hypothetical protein
LAFNNSYPIQVGAVKLKQSLKSLISKQIDEFPLVDFIFTNYEPLKAKITEMAISVAQK